MTFRQLIIRVGDADRVFQRLGGGGDTTIPSPGRSPKQPLPGIGLYDPLHGRQACPEFNSFHRGVGKKSPQEGIFSCRSFPKQGQILISPSPPPIVERLDNGNTRSEVDISLISPSRGSSRNGGEGGKCCGHTTRQPPTTTPMATPGWQTGPTSTPTSPKSVLLVFLGSEARGIFLCEMTPMRSPASHSR